MAYSSQIAGLKTLIFLLCVIMTLTEGRWMGFKSMNTFIMVCFFA